MTNEVLDKLVSNGDILSYEYHEMDENGELCKKSEFRNSERLTILFSSGAKLILDTFCSGISEDTGIIVQS